MLRATLFILLMTAASTSHAQALDCLGGKNVIIRIGDLFSGSAKDSWGGADAKFFLQVKLAGVEPDSNLPEDKQMRWLKLASIQQFKTENVGTRIDLSNSEIEQIINNEKWSKAAGKISIELVLYKDGVFLPNKLVTYVIDISTIQDTEKSLSLSDPDTTRAEVKFTVQKVVKAAEAGA